MDTTKPDNRSNQGVAKARTIDAMELLGTARYVVIKHQGERYELRLTKNGKLILTK